MAPINNLVRIKKSSSDEESLHIHRATRKISSSVRFLTYRDKDTRQIVIYIPSLELSGYGETEKEAEKMIRFSLNEYCAYLLKLPQEKMIRELSGLGWTRSKIKAKDFSKAYVDIEGNLNDFNAVGDKIEVGVLVTK